MNLCRCQERESFTYTDGELDDYYDAHAADLDSYDYRFCYINAEFEDKTDEDGNTVEPTEEETKAAWDAAAEKAVTKMIAEVRGGTACSTPQHRTIWMRPLRRVLQ